MQERSLASGIKFTDADKLPGAALPLAQDQPVEEQRGRRYPGSHEWLDPIGRLLERTQTLSEEVLRVCTVACQT